MDDHRLEFGQIKRLSWRELQNATNKFSEQNVLGMGGFGKVYKGVLPGPDSVKIAVKRLFDVESRKGELAFLTEVELISIAVHKNILRLSGEARANSRGVQLPCGCIEMSHGGCKYGGNLNIITVFLLLMGVQMPPPPN